VLRPEEGGRPCHEDQEGHEVRGRWARGRWGQDRRGREDQGREDQGQEDQGRVADQARSGSFRVSAEQDRTAADDQQRWIRQRAERALARHRVLPFLIVTTALVAVLTGVVARLIDHQDFHSVGDGVWWAIVTLGTVGYGDIVPHTVWGRVLGSVVIVCGVTFLSFLTAIVTSLFVTVDQEEALAKVYGLREESEQTLRTEMRALEERLAAIETKLDQLAESLPR
jgi:hypothetical protein